MWLPSSSTPVLCINALCPPQLKALFVFFVCYCWLLPIPIQSVPGEVLKASVLISPAFTSFAAFESSEEQVQGKSDSAATTALAPALEMQP